MSIRLARAGLSGLAIALIPISESTAHEIVGNRFFPATLGIDDPGVNDELAFPTVASFKTGDDPSFAQRDLSAEFSKRITEDFAVSFAPTYSFLGPLGGPTGTGANGFQNLGNHVQIPRLQESGARVRDVGRPQRRVGRNRRGKRRGRSVQHLHADDLFRQRARRSSRHAFLDPAGRDHRPVRLCDSRPELDHRLSASIPIAAMRRSIPNSIRAS